MARSAAKPVGSASLPPCFSAGLRRTELRELLAGSLFPNHPYALECQRDRGALLLILFGLWLFLLAIASQLAL